MAKIVDIPIVPGGFLSDVAENKLGSSQHISVKNLRLGREGEWQTNTPSADLLTGFTNLKAAIEVTEDVSGDRFLLVQDGTSIKRIDYDSGDGNGYENETSSTLTLPSGVTIASSATLRFHYFRGVVRISGASEPLWYGYIDRTLFYGDDQFSISDWFLKKENILQPSGTNDTQLLQLSGLVFDNTATYSVFVKFFYIFDDAQYELLKPIDNQTGSGTRYGLDHEVSGIVDSGHFNIRVNGTSLKNNMFNERLTGLGIALAVVQTNLIPLSTFIEKTEPYYVSVVLPFNEELGNIQVALASVQYDTASPAQIEVVSGNRVWEMGYIFGGLSATIFFGGSNIETSVTSVNFSTGIIIFDDDISSVMGATGTKLQVIVQITRKWTYDSSNGYSTQFGVNLAALGTVYTDFTGINQFSESINPDWRDHFVIANRAYVASLEDGEEDNLRYSPLNQFDVFPADNIIASEVGDTDSIVRAVKQDQFFIMLKRRSLSQGSYVSSYTEQIGLINRGLYAENGVAFFRGLLLFMDQDELYSFDGLREQPFFKSVFLREYYRNNVTSSGFIVENKLDNELWFVLGSVILVWQHERNESYFYIRELDITPTFGFLGYENHLFLGNASKLIDVNAESGSNENLGWSVTTRIFPTVPHRFFNKIFSLETLLSQSPGNISVSFKDDTVSLVSAQTITTPTTLKNRTVRSKKLFKELYLQLSNSSDSSSLSAVIRESNLRVVVNSGR